MPAKAGIQLFIGSHPIICHPELVSASIKIILRRRRAAMDASLRWHDKWRGRGQGVCRLLKISFPYRANYDNDKTMGTESISGISNWAVVIATFAGPIAAVQIQKFIEKATERRRSRTHLFYTLMTTRAARVSSDHVQALNMIEILFNTKRILFFDYQPKNDKNVIQQWRSYLDLLEEKADPNNNAAADRIFERRDNQFIELMLAISKSLGFDFDRVQIKKSIYSPKAHGDAEYAQLQIRDGILKILSGEQAIAMSVKEFPVSPDALELQKKVQEAIVDSLSGDKFIKVIVKNEEA